MTKIDYIMIGEALRRSLYSGGCPKGSMEYIVVELAVVLKKNNPKFDIEKFKTIVFHVDR